jgi:hypothetical protein
MREERVEDTGKRTEEQNSEDSSSSDGRGQEEATEATGEGV